MSADPEVTREITLPPMDSGARMSIDGMYRWLLWRRWDATLPTMTLVMLNPSTADHRTDDPTIRRCLSFARREGCGELVVVNLFAYRTPDPKDLVNAMQAGVDPWGERQADTMYWAFSNAHPPHLLVAAWGAHKVAEVAMHKVPERLPWLCLGTTKDGHPRHPLYVKGDQPLIPWVKP